jgi:hypothetical protein
MPRVGWVDTEGVLEQWLDAPSDGDELAELLETAYGTCSAYAPKLPAGAPVPAGWGKAQLLQAQHVYARGKSGNGDSIGPDGYQISTYPLVLESRSLIRPKRSPFAGLL